MSFVEDARTATCEKVEAFLLSWEKKYHMLWDQDIDIFMRCPSIDLWIRLPFTTSSNAKLGGFTMHNENSHDSTKLQNCRGGFCKFTLTNCRRYDKAQKSAEDFHIDLDGFRKVKAEVLAEASIEYVGFIQVETHQIKEVRISFHNLCSTHVQYNDSK